MKKKIKFLITFILLGALLFFLSSTMFTQQFNPMLTEEQRQQLEDYRKVLEEELVDPIEKDIQYERYTIKALQQLMKWLDQMSENIKLAYSVVDSPFHKMTAESSNEKCFTATANKYATPGVYPINIIQVAKADVLVSELVDRDLKLEGAEFVIASGDKEKTVKFRGGKIKALERALNKYGEKVFRARTIRKDQENYILVLEGLITGEANSLMFFGDTTPLQKIGMLYGDAGELEGDEETEETTEEENTEDEPPAEDEPPLLFSPSSAFNPIRGDYNYSDEELLLELIPDSLIEMQLSEPFTIQPESYIEVKVKTDEYSPEDFQDDPEMESLVGAGDTQDLEVETVGVIEEPYIDPFLPIPFMDSVDEESKYYYLGVSSTSSGIEQKLPSDQLANEEQWTTIKIGLNEYFEDEVILDKVYFFNELSREVIVFSEPKIYSEYEEPEEEPEEELLEGDKPDGNYHQHAQDSILRDKGIDFIRESNIINDFIEGAELTLKKKTDEEEELTIDHAYEDILEYIKELIDYNNLMSTFIYNTTRFDRDKTEEELLSIYKGEGMTQGEYEEAKLQGEAYERLLYNEREVDKIKTQLRKMMMGVYPTDAGVDISMLRDIGISNMDYEHKLENPLLEIDDDEFKSTLEKDFESVKQLFFKDTNEDNIMDNGLAVRIYNFLDIQRKRRIIPKEGVVYPGPIYAKIDIRRNRIEKELGRELEDAEEEVDKKVEELREQFIKMNEAKNEADSMNDMFSGEGGS
jgi:flagellar capping protein FliD